MTDEAILGCAECNNEVTVTTDTENCPICGALLWEQEADTLDPLNFGTPDVIVGNQIPINDWARRMVFIPMGGSLSEAYKPQPYMKDILAGLDRGEAIIPRYRIPTLFPGRKLEMLPMEPYGNDPTDRTQREKVTPIVQMYPLFPPENPGRLHRIMDVDYSKTSTVEIELRVENRMQAQMHRMTELMNSTTERVLLYSLGMIDSLNFKREKRIMRLLRSKDRRRVKRGERLFRIWRKTRPGYNLQGKSK